MIPTSSLRLPSSSVAMCPKPLSPDTISSGVDRSTTTRFRRPGDSKEAASRQAEMRDWMSSSDGGCMALDSGLSMEVLEGLLRRA